MSTAGQVTVHFLPDNLVVRVEAGTSLMRAARLAGLELKSTCGGAGTCGHCQVRIKEGFVRDKPAGDNAPEVCPAGPVLACQTLVDVPVVVDVPIDSRVALHQVLLGEKDVLPEQDLVQGQVYKFQPLCRKIRLTLAEPTLVGNMSDWTRLMTALREVVAGRKMNISLPVLRTLAETLRAEAWQVTATVVELNGCAEIVLLEPGHSLRPALGLAIDIGTTTVVVYLLDLETGLTLGKKGTYNRQARFGEDVITRIVYATEKETGLSELHEAVMATMNRLIGELLAESGIDGQDVHLAVVVGNTTMMHLFYALSPKYIRLEPYIPLSSSPPPVRAAELGLAVNPLAYVVSFPAVASYVGGDIVAGTLLTGMARGQEVTLFIDIGTNGEMVLGNRDWLVSVACSAGPAFEGGGITFGMRAMKGAIEQVDIEPKTYEVTVETIGGGQPHGICGSGLVGCLAKLRAAGIIDRVGRMQTDLPASRLRQGDDGPEFILVFAEETTTGKDIVLTENDCRNLLRAKAAVYAGIRCLLKAVQLGEEGLEKVLIAGGFGSHLNIRDAIAIGLLPDLPAEKYVFIGNSAVKGARQGLLSQEAFREALELGKKITYLELSTGNDFLEEFMSALFLPHTDRTLFSSVIS